MLRTHPLELEVCESSVRRRFRLHPRIAKSKATILIELTIDSAKKLVLIELTIDSAKKLVLNRQRRWGCYSWCFLRFYLHCIGAERVKTVVGQACQ